LNIRKVICLYTIQTCSLGQFCFLESCVSKFYKGTCYNPGLYSWDWRTLNGRCDIFDSFISILMQGPAFSTVICVYLIEGNCVSNGMECAKEIKWNLVVLLYVTDWICTCLWIHNVRFLKNTWKCFPAGEEDIY
jgi:hypothetical protein